MMKFSSRLKRAFVNCDCLIVIPTIVLPQLSIYIQGNRITITLA